MIGVVVGVRGDLEVVGGEGIAYNKLQRYGEEVGMRGIGGGIREGRLGYTDIKRCNRISHI